MKLYLVQHAEAKDKDLDPTRPLSDKGRNDIRNVTNFLKGKIEASKIVHSGKLRARQTAEELNEVVSSSVEEVDGLAPLEDSGIWEKRLREESEDTMIVGHLPHLSILAGLLLANDPNRRVIDFKRGGVVCLERNEEGNWSLQWMVTPEIL
ncbi:MAG: phosphohistidine phosphatase [Candidatus Methanolliviera sp. GoM_asphalt]|nr:MAG: phosphohistidine phosphatase [Candidatus Methanolliviera sp. GoM_asphalt]